MRLLTAGLLVRVQPLEPFFPCRVNGWHFNDSGPPLPNCNPTSAYIIYRCSVWTGMDCSHMFNYILPTRPTFSPSTDSTSIRNPEFRSLNLNIPFRAYCGIFAAEKEYDRSEGYANEKRFNVEVFHAPHVNALNPNGEPHSPSQNSLELLAGSLGPASF